jgi:hypothetical protein
VAGYAAALAPGSYVVLSVGRADDNDAARGFGTYSSASRASRDYTAVDVAQRRNCLRRD